MGRGNPRRSNGSSRRNVTRWLRMQARPCWVCGLPIDYGAPAGDPVAFECDELVPVSRNGSPYDRANVDAAHRCCNNWRSNRSVREVEVTRALVRERFGSWYSPLDFVSKARSIRCSAPAPSARPRPTTDW